MTTLPVVPPTTPFPAPVQGLLTRVRASVVKVLHPAGERAGNPVLGAQGALRGLLTAVT